MKSIKLYAIKRKSIIAILLGILLIVGFCTTFFTIKSSASPKPVHTIVIDVGHGGRDGGAVGKSGVTESELNLKYGMELATLCSEFGIRAVMTRKDMNGLYDETAKNKKRSEMERRERIINNSGADIMISVHMNSYKLTSAKGAQIFYASGDDRGFELAKSVQKSVCHSFESARGYVSVGDYYVLNCAKIPAILIECGFLSNPEEERLLVSDEYRKNFCYSVLAGILSYFSM